MEYYSGIQKVLKYLKSFSNFYVNVKGFPRLCLFKALWKVKVPRFEERFDLWFPFRSNVEDRAGNEVMNSSKRNKKIF